jgi:cytochrome c oxidase subunit II
MTNLAIASAVVLVLAILYLLFRINVLLGVAKGNHKKKVTGSNSVNAFLFIVFMVAFLGLFFWYSITDYSRYQLPVASAHGVDYEFMFWLTMAVTVVVFVITHILLFVFAYKYQYSEDRRASFYPDNTKLEIIWTAVPAVVLTVLVLYGWKTWTDITQTAPAEAEVVEIMGYQFAWKVRYPGKDGKLGDYDFRLIDSSNEFGMDFTDRASFDDFIPRMMVLPKGKPVKLEIRAKDVLHSVFAPHFRLKMDAVPGMPTTFWFVPTKTTEEMRAETGNPEFQYEIACTEICGRGHFSMRFLVDVVEEEEYNKWFAEQESWLSRNPDYLAKVPENLKELALIKTGISE